MMKSLCEVVAGCDCARFGREADAEGGATARGVFDPGCTVAAQGDFTHDGQPDAGAARPSDRFAAIEDVEDLFPFTGGYAAAVIPDLVNLTFWLLPAADFDRLRCC